MARYQYDDERYFVETGRTHNYVAMRPGVFGVMAALAFVGIVFILMVLFL